MKKSVFALVLFFLFLPVSCYAQPDIVSEAAILIEKETGTVIFEKNADSRLPMASVTKTMTLLLVAESLEQGEIKLTDIVTVSDKASSMTGSRVYLSTNEKISVSDLIKSISVSSGNDAAVAMAEYISGSEEQFVNHMNKKAEELGLSNTHFVNCYGLDAENHYSSARDLSVIASELLSHDVIRPFLVIWLDSIRDGSFTLANTNKLVKFYEGCTGVKTGFTSKAMYCLAASAKRDDMELIAVVLGGPDSKKRFADASCLLNFGFDNYSLINLCSKNEGVSSVSVVKGTSDSVKVVASDSLYVLVPKGDENYEEKLSLKKQVDAPVKKGMKLGTVTYHTAEKELGSVDLIAAGTVESQSLLSWFNIMLKQWYDI